jgi:hypothetical protein
MAKIRTVKPVYQSRNGELCFISREIINFNQDKAKKVFVSIVREQAFVEDEVERLDPETDEPTNVFDTVIRVVQDLGSKAHLVTYAQVDELFIFIGENMLSTESFTEKFDELQSTALLLDTQPYKLYNAEPTDWAVF